ncbi:MAG: hypothetical protein ACRD44_00755 [Bryobacteraceae bacterium]
MVASEGRANRVRKLPPLILHPFSDASGPGKLVESSRASLMLQGVLPPGEMSRGDLELRLREGRFHEIRMLFYVGRDVMRWIEQCAGQAAAEEGLKGVDLRPQSFACLLVDSPPAHVVAKLRHWGVVDYKAIFARAVALNCLFAEAPALESLSDEFIVNYYRYADQVFLAWRRNVTFAEISSTSFDFDLFASGEYTRMLERQWEQT